MTPIKLKPGFQYVDSREIHLEDVGNAVFMGDVGCTYFKDEAQKVLNNILKLETDLFIILGDLVFSQREEEFRDIIDFCNSRAKAPIFTLRGNHDGEAFFKFFGLSSYAMILDKAVLFIFDNSSGTFAKEELDFFEDSLIKYANKNFIVLIHIPPRTEMHPSHMYDSAWGELREVLDRYRDRIESIFTGHIHGYQEYMLDDYHIFITGGGGSGLYDMEKDTLKSHHVIKVFFDRSGKISYTVIPISKE